MILALDEELEMNVYEEEIEVCEFPQCMEYVQVYRILWRLWPWGKAGETSNTQGRNCYWNSK